VALGPPAEAEGAADQRPLPADGAVGAVGAHLEIPPTQLLFHLLVALLVALLDPRAPALEPRHLGQIRRGQPGMLGGAGRAGQRQIRDQIPGARLG